MFYGTITSDGSIDTSFSFSNNFSVSKTDTGVYTITFGEWMGVNPTLLITPSTSNPSSSHSAAYSVSTLSDGRYQATVYIYHDTSRESRAFGFRAMFGHSLTFDSTRNPTLTLTPSVVAFGSSRTNVLVLSTTISNLEVGGSRKDLTVKLDKGTALMGVGPALTLRLSASSVIDGHGNTWDLTGYTYAGGGAGDTGTPWNGQSTTLEVGSGGPVTTPELFVVKGTPHSGNSDQSTLSTDPLVRLSSVPPAGVAV